MAIDRNTLLQEASCLICGGMSYADSIIIALLQRIAEAQCGPATTCEMLSGSGSPVGAQTPDFIGQLYHDTDADTYWRSTGLTDADWVEISGGGTGGEGFDVSPLGTTDNIEYSNGTAFLEPIFDPVPSITALAFNGQTSVTNNINIEDDDILSVTFPDLASIGNIFNAAMAGCTSFSFPVLETVGSDFVIAAQSLTSIDVSSLESVGGNLTASTCESLPSFSAPLLETVGSDLDFTDCLALVTASFSSLTGVSSNITFSGCTALETLAFPSLTTIGSDITGPANAVLDDLDLSALTSASNVSFPNCTALTSLDLSAFTTLSGNFDFTDCTSLTSVSVPNFVLQNGNTIAFTGCALDAASINAILARGIASSVTACTFDLAGGTNAAPTGQGLVDKADLITAGNTVTTN